MENGTVCGLQLDRGFFFIRVPNMPDVFAHCNDLLDLEFNEQLRERRVQFDLLSTDRGLRAANVQAAE